MEVYATNFWHVLFGCLVLLAVYSGYRVAREYSGRVRVVGLALVAVVLAGTLLMAPLLSAYVIGTILGLFVGMHISYEAAFVMAMLVAFFIATASSWLLHLASRWATERLAP